MRVVFILIIIIFFNYSYAQIAFENGDIHELERQDTLYLSISQQIIPINTKIDFLDSLNINYNFSFKCFDNIIDLITTIQNGNEYNVIHNVFIEESNIYKLKYKYRIFSNRQESSLEGAVGTGQTINHFKVDKDNLYNNFSIKIWEERNIQDEKKYKYDFNFFKLVNDNFSKKRYKNLTIIANKYFIYEYKIIETEPVDVLNNLGYYLYISKFYKDSINLLEQIIQKYPDRVIAYLNLADSYWKVGNNEKAKENYKKYVELMGSQKKNLKKIPNYVYERIK